MARLLTLGRLRASREATSLAVGGGPTLESWPALDDAQFAKFRALVQSESGILLGEHKKALLVSRILPRMRALKLKSFSEYYERVVAPDGARERERMLDCICTNETRFFREWGQFELLEQHVIPEWMAGGARQIRAWSAACSTGEEPYSLAMMLWTRLPAKQGWTVDIAASDLSMRALARAKKGVWPLSQAHEIPQEYLTTLMLRGKGSQQGNMKAGAEIRRLITFTRINLSASTYPVSGKFDLILCRNVLIYFAPEVRAKVVGQLIDKLAPNGYLFLGHAETLSGITDRVQRVRPACYQLKPSSR